jgi:serine/threonine protein kinase
MALPTRDEFIECIRRSGLVEEERLTRFSQDHATQSEESQDLAKAAVETGILTAWQKDRLLEKKWKGFFLGKYKILYPLGAGAMGSVFLAEHRVMRHRVALKVLAKRLVSKPNNVARFEREARAAAVVNHINVVRAFDIDREGDTHYLVMEFVQGENLQKIVQTSGPLDPLLAAEYMAQVGRGLNEAHKNGMIHRDIKPSNVLLDPTGVVKILDLGLARIQDDDAPSLTIVNESKMIGTVDYLAPEQALNSHTIDGRADIYSLGCTLYYLLTGVPPFPSGSLTERILKHQSRRPMDIRKRRPGVPDDLVNICSRMMEKQPGRRFQTAGDAADALTAFCEGRLDELDLDESQQATEDSGVGLDALPEDSSSGRSGILSKSMAGKSVSTSRSMNAAGKSTATGKSSHHSVTDDLDLTPTEAAIKKSVGASLITGGSLSGSGSLNSPLPPEAELAEVGLAGEKVTPKAIVAPAEPKKKASFAAAEAPADLAPLTDQSIFGSAAPALDDTLTPLGEGGLSPLGAGDLTAFEPVSSGAATAVLDPLGMPMSDPLGANVLGVDPLSAGGLADLGPSLASVPTSPAATNTAAKTAPVATNTGATVAMKPAKSIWTMLIGEPTAEGEINFPLWLLIFAGLLLSSLLFLVGYLITSITA